MTPYTETVDKMGIQILYLPCHCWFDANLSSAW